MTSISAQAATCATFDKPKCRIQLPTGISMTYLELGPVDGETVILIHGETDSARSWAPTMAALHRMDPKLHILSVDLRGHGTSSMPPVDACAAAPERCFRMSDLADDIKAFMQAKQIRRATLAGHSMGSFVVQEMALNHPEMVTRAVLVATSTKGVDNAALRDYVLKEPVEGSWRKALEAEGKVYPEDFYTVAPVKADSEVRIWLAKNWVADPADPAFLKFYVPETAAVKLGTWIGATKALLATDNTERLKKLAVSTLAAASQQAPMFWKQYGRRPLPASGLQEDDIGHNVSGAHPMR
ncbi:alpha/beta fold hydrolase [Dongia soli]|uniref:Alpha/beta hydrolase n=1 Tax=Dongia soli TaxID=600628 RepID=A0ABU5E6U5_9PROT|nr:alpha/beta hydrolase [Dongia soli]MDY0881903.1 alpha/beta hydrolase [Dongia soli]